MSAAGSMPYSEIGPETSDFIQAAKETECSNLDRQTLELTVGDEVRIVVDPDEGYAEDRHVPELLEATVIGREVKPPEKNGKRVEAYYWAILRDSNGDKYVMQCLIHEDQVWSLGDPYIHRRELTDSPLATMGSDEEGPAELDVLCGAVRDIDVQ